MPLFFVLSGLVFKPYKPGSKFIKKKIKSLIIPYIIFYILTLAVFWIVEQPLRDPAVKNAAAHNELLRFIPLLYGADVRHLMSHNIELWFLPCLFSIEIIYNAICIHIKNNYEKVLTIICICVLGYILSRKGVWNLPWGLSPAFIMIPFFYIGDLSKKLFTNNIKRSVLIVSLILSICLFILLDKSIIRFDIAIGRIPNPIQFIITSTAGICLIITFSQLLRKNKLLEFFGKGDVTLVTLAIQGIVYRPLIFLCNKICINGFNQESLITVTIISILTYIICGIFSIAYYRIMNSSIVQSIPVHLRNSVGSRKSNQL